MSLLHWASRWYLPISDKPKKNFFVHIFCKAGFRVLPHFKHFSRIACRNILFLLSYGSKSASKMLLRCCSRSNPRSGFWIATEWHGAPSMGPRWQQWVDQALKSILHKPKWKLWACQICRFTFLSLFCCNKVTARRFNVALTRTSLFHTYF